ncbi:MAG: EFR1 family ferrodoxin [Paludibacteraceae bacterium]|nr:EFR1 family ferrodoxin [Paludibacteraceae bacterium]
MVIYFSGTGNSLAIARSIAAATNEQVLPLTQAVREDLTSEKRIGLVYPSYDFNVPPAVRTLVPKLQINARAYVFIIIPCGAQAGNSSWTVRKLLQAKGIRVAYTHKIRVPDNSAIVFGRNPNDQKWKFRRFASRLQTIIDDVKAERHAYHYSWWSPLAWVMGTRRMEEWMLRTFRPAVNESKCIGCGICVKMCPMRNIAIDEKAGIGPHCTACLACLHACPQQAIEAGGKPTIKERQYCHPDIKRSDLSAK